VEENLGKLAEKYGSPDEAIIKKTKELTNDAITDRDKAVAIHKFVKERFKEVEWPLQDSLLLFNDAGRTYAAGQGTNLELALLQRAMLKAAAINGELALAGPLPVPDKAPGLMPFDRVVVLVDTVCYEPCHSISALPKLGALLREKGDFHEGGADWGGVLRGTVELSNEVLKGTAALALTGGLNPYSKNLEEESALEEAVKAFIPVPGLQIESITPLELNYSITRLDIKFSGKFKESDRIVPLLPESKVFLPGLDPRVTSTAMSIRLPDVRVSIRWTVKGAGKGEPVELKPYMRPGELSIIRKPTEDGFTLDAELDLLLDTLPSDGYPGLQAAMAAWQNPVVAGVLLP
jgi:hypothetical protein